ncbi:hypothetical protein [Jannaschia formosa]|uniref:hypothetical protein n=1 Tax=Jannaschia formosa TaxID=2259592 RepID=UPI0010758021|nr:hypothetical protein [Jannaschia formosa]TFL16002.1 hypothetical protein DR046_22270 [Jannaschia formosa]
MRKLARSNHRRERRGVERISWSIAADAGSGGRAPRDVEEVAGDAGLFEERLGQAHPGRYLLTGSAARGEMRHDSAVEMLADFPLEEISAAAGGRVRGEDGQGAGHGLRAATGLARLAFLQRDDAGGRAVLSSRF